MRFNHQAIPQAITSSHQLVTIAPIHNENFLPKIWLKKLWLKIYHLLNFFEQLILDLLDLKDNPSDILHELGQFGDSVWKI